jgi:hypothetical protein
MVRIGETNHAKATQMETKEGTGIKCLQQRKTRKEGFARRISFKGFVNERPEVIKKWKDTKSFPFQTHGS